MKNYDNDDYYERILDDEAKKQLQDFMRDISLSSITEPVRAGELEIALNVLERLREQAPEMYKNMLQTLTKLKP